MSTIATSGPVSRDRAQELAAVGRLADDLETGVGEQPGEPFAQEHLVVGDHDAHGSSARTSCGRRALDGELAVERADAVLEVDEVAVQDAAGASISTASRPSATLARDGDAARRRRA